MIRGVAVAELNVAVYVNVPPLGDTCQAKFWNTLAEAPVFLARTVRLFVPSETVSNAMLDSDTTLQTTKSPADTAMVEPVATVAFDPGLEPLADPTSVKLI
jgi:hypothetical protein